MKKLIQICAVLSLVFAFSIVSARAQQTVKQYEAKIPFAFNVGQKSYRAATSSKFPDCLQTEFFFRSKTTTTIACKA